MKKYFKFKKLVNEMFEILLDVFKILYFSVKNIILYRKLADTDLTIVTGSDYTHFESVLNLLDSIKIYEPNTNTVLYDIGFQSSQLKFLNENYKNITIKKFNFDKYPKFFLKGQMVIISLAHMHGKAPLFQKQLTSMGDLFYGSMLVTK